MSNFSQNAFAICSLSFIPVRKEPSHRSEMTTQLIFGDFYRIINSYQDWFLIENYFDLYQGWIPSNAVNFIDYHLFELHTSAEVFLQKSDFAVLRLNSYQVTTGIGSSLYFSGDQYFTGNNQVKILQGDFVREGSLSFEQIIACGKSLLNIPYLWGGRSSMGIDCSGLTQCLYRLAGIRLPRDAWQQEKTGEEISFNERISGDLAFFKNDEGKIIHTGIVLNGQNILHASGKVKIDVLSQEGIRDSLTGQLTHKLKSIKRLS